MEEERSQSVHQPIQMLAQGLVAREEARLVLFWEENVELGGYASVQTPKACVARSEYGASKAKHFRSIRFDREALVGERRYGTNIT